MEKSNIVLDDILAEKLMNIKHLNKLYIKTKDTKTRDIIQELFAYFGMVFSSVYGNWENDFKPLIKRLLKKHKYDEFKFLYYNFNIDTTDFNNYIIRYAIKYNFIAIVKLLIENKYNNFKRLFHYAIKYDNISILEYAYQFVNKNDYINEIGIESVKYNRKNIAAWAIKHAANANKMAAYASEYNNLDLLKEITTLTKINTHEAAIKSIEVNDIDVFKYLMSIGIEHYETIAEYAANYGRLNILKIIPENTYNKDTIVSIASEYGHLNIIKWFYKNGYTNIVNIALSAAKNGHEKIITWTVKKGFNSMFSLAIIAAENGHLDIVKYAYLNGSNNIEEILNTAALNDHPEIVKWALENGAKNIEEVKRAQKIYGYKDLEAIINEYDRK